MLGGRVARMVAGLLLGLPGSLSATAGGDWYVDFSQGAAGDGSALNPFPTLAAAVSAAGEGDTIRIAGDGSASASAETPRITKGIRIEAEGGAVCIGALNAPTVTALTQAAAEQAILDAGFAVGTVTQAYSDTVAAEAVISQSLAAGSHLAPGTAIELVVSLGPALRANFIVYNNTFEGQVPLLVEFADTSQPGPHPIQTWAWDFDNDGVTDSTKQYPVHFYTKPGTYSVRLRVVSDDGTDELTRVNLVEAMPVDAPDGVSVDAGWFEMGDPWQEGASDELPVHDVFLSSYWLGQSEVTNGDYVEMLNWALRAGYLSEVTATTVEGYGRELMRLEGAGLTYSGNYFTSIYVNFGSLGESLITSYLPVVEVTWYGAAAYCNWLSETRGLTPCYNTVTWACDFSKDGYHLPTEAQWERAASWESVVHLRYGNGSDSISCATANYHGTGLLQPRGLHGCPLHVSGGVLRDREEPGGLLRHVRECKRVV